MWIPVGRREMKALFDSPGLLHLCCLLRDETYRAQWTYADNDPTGWIYFRGVCFESIEPHTFLFDLDEQAERFGISSAAYWRALRILMDQGHLDALHIDFENELFEQYGQGTPIQSLLGYYEDYDRDAGWTPSLLHMPPLPGGFIRIPKETLYRPTNMLRMLVWLHLRATFRGREVVHRGRTYQLGKGEVVASLSDLERAIGVHRRQISRWAEYALRDGLLLRIPEGHDARWQVKTFPRRPKS
jgi:hypothetical protein